MSDDEETVSSTVKRAMGDEIGRHGYLDESPVDELLKHAMVQDPNLISILKGEFEGYIVQLRQWIHEFGKAAQNGQLEVNQETVTVIEATIIRMEKHLNIYHRVKPYLMLLSHLMRLSNISKEEAQHLKTKVAVIVSRDQLTLTEGELELINRNFFDALEILCYSAINDSTEGWKMRSLTEQRRYFHGEIEETQKKRKKKWGIF